MYEDGHVYMRLGIREWVYSCLCVSRGHFSRKSAFSVRRILKGQGTPLKHEGNSTGPPAAGLESGSREALAASPQVQKPGPRLCK